MSETTQQAAATPQPTEAKPTTQTLVTASTHAGKDSAAPQQATEASASNDVDASRQFAALTRKQKELFLKEQELKERQKKYDEASGLDALLESDPLEYLNKKGLKFEDLMQRALKQGEEPTLEEKIAALQKKIEDDAKARDDEKKKALEDQDKAKKEAEQKFIDDFKKKIETDVKAESDKYELINAQQAFGLVYSVIEETWETTRQVLPISEAAEKVEEYLLGEARKLLSLKKLGTSSATPSPAAQTQSKDMPTLNSSMTPAASSPSKSHLSEEESLREAAKLLRWN